MASVTQWGRRTVARSRAAWVCVCVTGAWDPVRGRDGLSCGPVSARVDETETMVRGKLRPKLRHCIYQGKKRLRPWFKFLRRENSDHGLGLGCFGGRSRRRGFQFHSESAV